MKTDLTNYAWTQGVVLAACNGTRVQFITQDKSFSHSTDTIKVKKTWAYFTVFKFKSYIFSCPQMLTR